MNPFKYLLKIHDSLWADAFYFEKYVNRRERNWKRATYINMSLILSFNIATFLSILNYLGYDKTIYLDKFLLSTMPSKTMAKLVIGILEVLLPAFAFSYFTVFFTKRYKYILDNFEYKNGKLIKIYLFSTILFYWGFIILRYFLTKD